MKRDGTELKESRVWMGPDSALYGRNALTH